MEVSKVNFWIKKAFQWIKKHPSVVSVSDIEIEEGLYQFTAIFKINLPGKYDLQGKTKHGIKKYESVLFVFPKDFPYRAPKIYLRDDFNRNFPHINPVIEKVNPCIFDGSLDELLQQPKWFDHILDQVAEWLENAAANTLISPMQGWEPARMDAVHGIILYSKQQLLEIIASKRNKIESLTVYYKIGEENIFAAIGNINGIFKNKTGILIFRPSEDEVCDNYFPNFVNKFSDLVDLARISKINNFVDKINGFIKENNFIQNNKKIIFIILAVNRPFKLINSNTNIELFNFAIELKYQKKNGRIHFKSRVYTLAHREICTPELLRQFSGIQKSEIKNIIQVGCGSLGSKITLHLARNGNDCLFTLIDNSYFSPHNNARHALINFLGGIPKVNLLKNELKSLGISQIEDIHDDILNVWEKLNNRKNAILIDSTANISVRNFLSKYLTNIPIIHTSLYSQGRMAVMIVEANDKNPRIDDLLALIYLEALSNVRLRDMLFSENAVYRSIGQGCGSYTTICPDSIISLSAAGIAGKIQQYLSQSLPQVGEISIGYVDSEGMSIYWEKIICEKVGILPPDHETDFEIRILPNVIRTMNNLSKRAYPSETGGALIGHISLTNNVIIVSDLIEPPDDSKSSPNYFELGRRGLKASVKDIETKSNGLLTYVGTWHSHPKGGGASSLDINTKQRLYELRGYEPTVCLIWTPNGIIRV